MNPTGGMALLVVAVAAVTMIVYAIMKSNKEQMVHSSDQDKIRRVKLTLSTTKAEEFSHCLSSGVAAVNEKKKADDSSTWVQCYVDDANGRGPTLVEVEIKRT